MTCLVGYSPHKDDSCALELACQLARSESDTVHAVTVVPRGWHATAGSQHDRDFVQWARAEGEASAAEALEVLARHPDVESEASWISGRSVPATLLQQVEESNASIIVLGSGANGPSGRVTMTSKTNRLLHSSSVPIAIAPRGYLPGPDSRVNRVTVGFRDDDETWHLLNRVSDICRRNGSAVRIVTFAIRHRTMASTTVSRAEDLVFDQWLRQAAEGQVAAVEHLRQAGFAADAITAVVAEGTSWDEAMSSVDWGEGDLLVVGSSSTHRLSQVFLGSSAAKIVRASTVPVVVLP